MYEVYSTGEEKEIESAETESGLLRKEDRELLQKGIVVYDRDEALMLIEDFVS